MPESRVKVYRTPAEMHSDVADAAAHGWRVSDQRPGPDGTMRVTFEKVEAQWVRATTRTERRTAPGKRYSVLGAVLMVGALLVLAVVGLYPVGRPPSDPGDTSRPTGLRAAAVGGFGAMEEVVAFHESRLGFDGHISESGSWYSDMDEDRGLGGTVIDRGGVADELQLSIVVGVDEIGGANALRGWLNEFAPAAAEWVIQESEAIDDGQRRERRFGDYVATLARFDNPRPIVVVALDHD